MKHIPAFLLFLLFGYQAGGQSVNYTLQQINETRQLYDKTVTTTTDTTLYRLTVPDTIVNGPMILRLSMLSFTSRVTSRLNGNQIFEMYYTSQKKIKNDRLQMAYDNLDATRGALRNKEVTIIFDPAQDTIYALNADSIVKALPGVPIGLLESVRTYFSNDYFTGFFHSFLFTNFQEHRESNAQWTQVKEVVSALQPRYADRSYTTRSVSKDSICVAVTGPSFYRDPPDQYNIHGPKYCSGTEDGMIVYRTSSLIPWRMDMHYVIIFQTNTYSSYVETWISDSRIRFIQE